MKYLLIYVFDFHDKPNEETVWFIKFLKRYQMTNNYL